MYTLAIQFKINTLYNPLLKFHRTKKNQHRVDKLSHLETRPIKIELDDAEKLGSQIEPLQRSTLHPPPLPVFVFIRGQCSPLSQATISRNDIDAGSSTGGAASYRFTRLSASNQGTGLKIVPENTTRGNSIAARP